MPDLPARPDLDQLRHQARDLLRAAQRGDPEATARIRAVAGRIVVGAAGAGPRVRVRQLGQAQTRSRTPRRPQQPRSNAGAPVNGRPGDTETPLITTPSYGDAEVAQVLINAGADIDAISAPDSGGVPSGTALQHAAVFGMTEVVDVLVAAGRGRNVRRNR
jgi:hypothetical protein